VKKMKRLLILGLMVALCIVALPVMAVTPTVVEGNPTCADLGLGLYGFKPDGACADGTYYFTGIDGDLEVGTPEDAINYVTLDCDELDSVTWASSIGIDAVIVKGGMKVQMSICMILNQQEILDLLHQPSRT